MELSRRQLLKSALVLGGAGALSREMVFGSLSERAVAAGPTTLSSTFAVGPSVNEKGYRKIVAAGGQARRVRTDLDIPASRRRSSCRTDVLAFAQLSDIHIIDHESPARVEWTDRYDDENPTGQVPGLFASAWRPQEALSAQVSESMVRAVNAITSAPVTGLPLMFAIETGDNTDNCQRNEVRWNIDVLDGGRPVTPGSGGDEYEGVQDDDPAFYDVHYWHPHGTPESLVPGTELAEDNYRAQHGFPVIEGLMDAARKPFTPTGLEIPWYTCFGNHDGLAQGNFPPNTTMTGAIATGSLKVISPPAGVAPSDVREPQEGDSLDDVIGPLSLTNAKPVTPDPNRRHLTRGEIVDEHFVTTGLPRGHGFTEANRTDDTAYYFFDRGTFRFVVMDTVNPNGNSNGSLDAPQFEWLKRTVVAAKGKAVLVFSHHTSATMDNSLVITGLDPHPRVLGPEVTEYLLSQPRVIAWVNGHTHRNEITPHRRADGSGGFWEINTAAHIDYPQQARLIEVTDNRDRTMSIFTTIIDHAAPAEYGGDTTSVLGLASLARELAANDPQANLNATGTAVDRNTELLVATPADVRRASCGAGGTSSPSEDDGGPGAGGNGDGGGGGSNANSTSSGSGAGDPDRGRSRGVTATAPQAAGTASAGVLPDTGAPSSLVPAAAAGLGSVLAGSVLVRRAVAGDDPATDDEPG